MNKTISAVIGLGLLATPLVATTAAASEAPSERKARSYSVTLKSNKATVIAEEDTVKFRGKVTPRAAGAKVILQQRLDGKKKWSVSGKAKIKPNGKFVIKDDPSTAGTRFYRVVKPAKGKLGKGVSRQVEIVVYAWDKLTFRLRGAQSNTTTDVEMIETDAYPYSIVNEVPGTPATVEYTLGKKCLTLRATYAVTDASETGGTGSVALRADGVVAFASTLALGQAIKDQETDIRDAFRITYEFVSSTAPDSFVTAATPEVLCTK